MSRNWIRPMHKFGTKPVRSKNFSINPVEWSPKNEVAHKPVKHPGCQVYEIFAQRAITIDPRETETLEIGLGVRMRRGWCKVQLKQEIQNCGLQDDVVSKNTEDIVITILNDSDSEVVINEGDSLCLVAHTSRSRSDDFKIKLFN